MAEPLAEGVPRTSEVAAHGPVTVAFKTLGCKVNRAESDAIAARLIGQGVTLTAEEEAAVVIVDTCTVTGEADRKARKAVRHALGLPHGPVVVVTGCLAAIDAGMLARLGQRVVVEADKDAVPGRVAGLLGIDETREVREAREPSTLAGAPALRAGDAFRTRVTVKIEDGCDAFCSYCIVPHARGLPRSVPLEAVVAEVGALVASGVAEVVLSGINLGRYADPASGATLPDVVEAVAATGVARIRLSSIEPNDLTPRLLDALAHAHAVCPHLHVPLQSGADTVLHAMGRPYTVAGYAKRIDAARAALPGLAVTTDVIAGFPGETGADAQETLDTVRALGFARLHVFRFSPRTGTPAARMPAHVDPSEIAARADRLRALDAELRERYARSRIGTLAEMLVESVDDPGVHGGPAATGTTREYLRVCADGTGRAAGETGTLRLVAIEGDVLLGEWVRNAR